MLENAVYSVITPEGCAAILWKSAGKAPEAAEGLKLTADQLIKFGIIDEIIAEPAAWTISDDKNGVRGNAYSKIADTLKRSIARSLDSLVAMDTATLLENRYQKFRTMGEWI